MFSGKEMPERFNSDVAGKAIAVKIHDARAEIFRIWSLLLVISRARG